MKFVKFLSVALLASVMTSCLGDAENVQAENFTNYCFNYVTDMSTGTSETTWGATYMLETNYTDGVATFNITGLKLASSQSVSLSFSNMKYSYNEKGGFVIKAPSYESSYNGQRHTVTDFSMEYYRRSVGTRYLPAMFLTFKVDNAYSVRVVYTPSAYLGTTAVVDADGKSFSSQKPYYAVAFDPTKSISALHILGAQFAEGMPAMDMVFTDIPVTFSHNGFEMAKAELIPQIGNTPYQDFKITDLTVSAAYEGMMTVNFTCTIDTKTMKGRYKVTAYLDVLPSETQN